MKLRYLILSLALCLSVSIGFSSIIKGTVKNAVDGDVIYLYEYFGGDDVLKLDSSKITSGQFQIKIGKNYGEGVYTLGYQVKDMFPFVYIGKDLSVELENKSFRDSGKVLGSKVNDDFKEYNAFWSIYYSDYRKIASDLQSGERWKYTNPEQYQSNRNEGVFKLDSLHKAFDHFNKDFKATHKNYIGDIAGLFVSDVPFSKDNFLQPDNFSKEKYFRGDVLPNKINVYLIRFAKLSQKNFRMLANKVLLKTGDSSRGREVAYATLIRIGFQVDKNAAWDLTDQMSEEFENSKFTKEFIQKVPPRPPRIGELAKDIVDKNVDGVEKKLSNLKGKIVLIDFWASWCGPCRGENPNVVRLYNKYKDKGFTVFSVSLDNSKDKWQQAIQADGLAWENHVSDLKGWRSSAAKLYQVTSIPTTYLIDRDGKIIGANLRGHDLEDKLAELFGF